MIAPGSTLYRARLGDQTALSITGSKDEPRCTVSRRAIIDKDGRAIGVVCTGSESKNIKDYVGPHTNLIRSFTNVST